MNTLTSWQIVLVVSLVLLQALWIFRDARVRGENAWLWGTFGLLNVPSSLLVYLIVTRTGGVRCPRCGHVATRRANFCPHCGAALARRETDRTV